MGKSLSAMSTEVLMSSQNIIAVANQHMDQFATDLENEWKANRISKSFLERTNNDLHEKVKKNNEIIKAIDIEVLSRLKKNFPTATTGGILDSLMKKYHKEVEEHGPKKDNPKKPVIKMKSR